VMFVFHKHARSGLRIQRLEVHIDRAITPPPERALADCIVLW